MNDIPTGRIIFKEGNLVPKVFNKTLLESIKKLKYLKKPKIPKLKTTLFISQLFLLFEVWQDSIFKPA